MDVSEERTAGIFRVEEKTSVNIYQTTRHHIPEKSNLHRQLCENRKSQTSVNTFLCPVTIHDHPHTSQLKKGCEIVILTGYLMTLLVSRLHNVGQ
jgi:hypothetical protein